jgi:MFS transporter, DHA1 family, tetracycline resistance protein
MTANATPPPSPSPRPHAVAFVFVTVLIDAMGIGIIIPVTPDLIKELADLPISGAALWGGYLSFIYALMQFAFAPVLGNLSDRFGRRPVLLVSLAALTVDYLIMGLAPTLVLLFVGRLLAGIAGATHSTANAYMADISAPSERAKNFGLLGAAFGVGFIVGPVVGGVVGEIGTRAPFFAAAGLAAANFLYGAVVLPETLPADKRRVFAWRRANPLGVARQIAKSPTVTWFFAAYFLFTLAHFVYAAIWAYYAKEVFSWSNAEVGLSLAAVGVGFAVVQGWLIRYMLPRWGEARTTLAGFIFSIIGLVAVSFATEGWVIYLFIPVMALGAVVTPALIALMANRVSDDAQGELQGALTSVAGITLILSPLIMTQLFAFFSGPETPIYFPGAPFLVAAILMLAALVPFGLGLRREPRK